MEGCSSLAKMHSKKRTKSSEHIVSLIDSGASTKSTSQEIEGEENRSSQSTGVKERQSIQLECESVERRREEWRFDRDVKMQDMQEPIHAVAVNADQDHVASQLSEVDEKEKKQFQISDSQPANSMDVDALIESGEGRDDEGEQSDAKFRISNSQAVVHPILDGEDTGSQDRLVFRIGHSQGSHESTQVREEGSRLQHCDSIAEEDSLGSANSGLSQKRGGQAVRDFRIQNSQMSVESLEEVGIRGENSRKFQVRDSIGSVSSIEEFELDERQIRESAARGSQTSFDSVEEAEAEQDCQEPVMDSQGTYAKLLPGPVARKGSDKVSAIRKLQVPLKKMNRSNAPPSTSKGIDSGDTGLAAPLQGVSHRGGEKGERLESNGQKRWSASEDEITESLDGDDDYVQRRNSAGSSGAPEHLTSSSALWANFRQVLDCAPPSPNTADGGGRNSGQELFSLSDRLENTLRRLNEQREQFKKVLTNGSPMHAPSQCLVVSIEEKKLEAAQLTTCKCEVLESPQDFEHRSDVHLSDTALVDVIFSSKMCPELKLETGGVVRIYPPWQEIPGDRESGRIVLSTFFCDSES